MISEFVLVSGPLIRVEPKTDLDDGFDRLWPDSCQWTRTFLGDYQTASLTFVKCYNPSSLPNVAKRVIHLQVGIDLDVSFDSFQRMTAKKVMLAKKSRKNVTTPTCQRHHLMHLLRNPSRALVSSSSNRSTFAT